MHITTQCSEGLLDSASQLLWLLDHPERHLVYRRDRRARHLRVVAQESNALGERGLSGQLLVDIHVLHRCLEQISELPPRNVEYAIAGQDRKRDRGLEQVIRRVLQEPLSTLWISRECEPTRMQSHSKVLDQTTQMNLRILVALRRARFAVCLDSLLEVACCRGKWIVGRTHAGSPGRLDDISREACAKTGSGPVAQPSRRRSSPPPRLPHSGCLARRLESEPPPSSEARLWQRSESAACPSHLLLVHAVRGLRSHRSSDTGAVSRMQLRTLHHTLCTGRCIQR